jgi:hypothetical protein
MSHSGMIYRVPTNSIDGLREAAVPRKSLFRKRDGYWDYLEKNAQRLALFDGTGEYIVILLEYLEEKHRIDVKKSESNALAETLTKLRGITHLVFTDETKPALSEKLKTLTVTEMELTEFYNQFEETDETEAGAIMLDGLKSIRDAIAGLNGSQVVLLIVD